MRKPPELVDLSYPSERMLTIRQASRLLGVGRGQINKWMLEGKMKAIYVGRERRFPVWYLRQFQQDQLESIEKHLSGFPSSHPMSALTGT